MRAPATQPSIQLAPILPLPMPTAVTRRTQRSRFGELEVVQPLATGGMGGVYLAAHVTTGERFALKVLDGALAKHPEVVARLHAEHAIAQRSSHPGLVRIHAARGGGTTGDAPYLVMEYLDGDCLTDLAGDGGMPLPQIYEIGAQIAAALAALHDAGVVHCDVKPDNVLVLRDGRVKVLDFGVSRLVDEVSADSSIAGTPWCMAPEQWNAAPEPASDVYALGCLLFDLVTGDAPFAGSLPELMFAHQEMRPARPSWLRTGVPAALDRLILRALAKAAADRPTMEEMALALAELADCSVPEQLRHAS
jgi:serine/threonine-protein kinase